MRPSTLLLTSFATAVSASARADWSAALPGISGSIGPDGMCGNILGIAGCIGFPHLIAASTSLVTRTEVGQSTVEGPRRTTSWTSVVTITSTGFVVPVAVNTNLSVPTTPLLTFEGPTSTIRAVSSTTVSTTTATSTSSSSSSSSRSSSTAKSSSSAAAAATGKSRAVGFAAGIVGAALLL